MCVYVLFSSSTSSTYIALQPLCVFDLSSTSLTYIALHSMKMRMTSRTSSTCHIPCTLYSVQITMDIVIQSIRIRTNFKLKPRNSLN